jgi:PAS domain-containing protein
VPEQRSVVVILARELATNVATPMFIMDKRGSLVFFNEPAERIVGETFASTGELAPDEWADRWHVEDPDGNRVTLLELPLIRVLTERIPVHANLRVKGLDGVMRSLSATAYPLYAKADKFVGAVGVFWEDDARTAHGALG